MGTHTNKTSAKSGHKSKSHRTTDHNKSRSQHHTSKHTSKSQHHTSKSRAHTTTHHETSSHRGNHVTTTTSTSERHNTTAQKGWSTSLGPGVSDPVLLAFLVILGISAIVMFSIGVWLLATRTGWPVGLNLTGSRAWTRFLSYGTAALLLFFIFIFVIIFAFLAASTKRGASARINRLLVVFFASLAFLILFLMTFNAIFFAANSPGFIRDIIRDGWINTVTDFDRQTACRIQDRFNCEGWENGSCIGCRPTIDGEYDQTCTAEQRNLCPRCFTFNRRRRNVVSAAAAIEDGKVRRRTTVGELDLDVGPLFQPRSRQNENVRGCRGPVLRAYRRFFIPMSVYTIFLALIVVLLAWKTCIDSSGR